MYNADSRQLGAALHTLLILNIIEFCYKNLQCIDYSIGIYDFVILQVDLVQN